MTLSTNNIMIEEEDKISMLPDELIHNILSFIDTIYAVQTCVLSKRWVDIWKSLPFLNFHNCDYTNAIKQSDEYQDFMDRVFIFRDDCSIQRFTLALHSSNLVSIRNLNRWIDVSVRRNVQEVTIDLGPCYDNVAMAYTITPKLLNCKSLKKLTLRIDCNSLIVYTEVILPKSMSLPQLKFMCLGGILVSNVELSRLFRSCPLLETLILEKCDIQTDNQKNITIESLSLKQLVFTYPHSNGSGYDIKPDSIKLSSPNLNSFTCEFHLTQDFHLQNCSDQLSHVKFSIYNFKYLNLHRPEETEVYARRMMKLLVAVDKVKRLELSPGFLEVLSRANDLVNYKSARLCILQSLRLGTWFTRDSVRAVAYLLTMSPNIKTLILKPIKPYSAHIADDWEVGLSLPGILFQLSLVQIENVRGYDAELKILSFLLKNAKGLEEVALYPCSTVRSLSRLTKRFQNNLRALPGASSTIRMTWEGRKSIPHI